MEFTASDLVAYGISTVTLLTFILALWAVHVTAPSKLLLTTLAASAWVSILGGSVFG